MTRTMAPVCLLLLASCGTMTPNTPIEERVQLPPSEAPPSSGIQSTTEDIDFGTNPTWSAGGEIWVLTFDLETSDPLADGLMLSGRDMLIEILTDDPPQIQVRTAAVLHGSNPVLQDPCTPSTQPAPGILGPNGDFSLNLPPGAANLGQPLAWRDARLVGQRDQVTETGGEGVWQGEILASDLADLLYGDPLATDTLSDDGYELFQCDEYLDCVMLDLPVTLVNTPDFVMEPLTDLDVQTNPDCY